MPELYLSYGALITPFGHQKLDAWNAIQAGKTAVKINTSAGYNHTPLPVASCDFIQGNRYDSLLELGITQFHEQQADFDLAKKTAIIVSSTKGNLDDLNTNAFASTRRILNNAFPNATVTIISNACISGILAINLAADYIKSAVAEQVIIIGIDAVSDFINYGFQSLFALSDLACKPFDKNRNGTSLGEACAILFLTKEQPNAFSVAYLGGASSNDANHISGPSRTGEGLYRAIQKTLERTEVNATEIDFVSAHGTATIYNDEMESIAFDRSGLNQTPLHSLKGYFGHTLGAAGVLETYLALQSMEQQTAVKSLGFEESGTSIPLQVQTKNEPKKIDYLLKTASGFGGGNAACLIKLIEA